MCFEEVEAPEKGRVTTDAECAVREGRVVLVDDFGPHDKARTVWKRRSRYTKYCYIVLTVTHYVYSTDSI